MSLGRPSGVEYEHWFRNSDGPRFAWNLNAAGDYVECEMTFKDPPFLMEAMKKIMSLAASCSCEGESPNPVGTSKMFNYAKEWMK
jgi:hypothetical protein